MRPVTCLTILVLTLISLNAVASPITPADATLAADELAASVGGYSIRHPGEPGGCRAWTYGTIAAGTIVASDPLLVHSYPDLEPSYYYLELTTLATGARTFVTIDAATGGWQAFGTIPDRAPFPAVGRDAAASSVARQTGLSIRPDELRAVSMPNKQIYWLWSDGAPGDPSARLLFVSVSDRSDIHDGVDSAIAPTQPTHPEPRESELAPAEKREPHESVVPVVPQPRAQDRSRYPGSYDITAVPHHYQVTSYNCGPAASEMVMDYYGADIYQEDIADVANCVSSGGSYADDVRRTGHFSGISSAIQNASLLGYDERKLGYGALDCWWSYPGTGDPDYPDRYNDLRELISSDFPILVLTWYDTSHNGGHFRVIKGYNDTTNVFIVHDPWYNPPYQGPDVNFNQNTLVDNLWTQWYRWGTLVCPWEVQVDCPSEVEKGETFTVNAIIYYHGPHPFEGQDTASSRIATIDTTPIFSLAVGETATKTIPGAAASGVGNLVSWQVVADTVELGNIISVRAQGYISDSSTSYPSYADSIGGWGSKPVTIVPPTGINDHASPALAMRPARPTPFAGETTLELDVPADAGRVRLAVYNVRGELIYTLADGDLGSGRNVFTWDGTDDAGRAVAAGVYFARCDCDVGRAVRKLVLMR